MWPTQGEVVGGGDGDGGHTVTAPGRMVSLGGRRVPVLDRGTRWSLRLVSSPCEYLVDVRRAEVKPSGQREYQSHQQREPAAPPYRGSILSDSVFTDRGRRR
jgi:hypothetical protein